MGKDILDAALTTDRWKDRLLGGNRMFDGPLHVTRFGTGNNVQLHADTSRRVCHVRMESADERPELRADFKYADPRGHVRGNRGTLLSAARTIPRGVTATEVIAALKSTDEHSAEWQAEMRSAAEELCGKLDARLLGFKFRHFERRNFDGKMPDVAGTDRQHGNRWTVMAAAKMRAEPPPAPPTPEPPVAGDAGDAGDRPAPDKSAATPPAGKRRYTPNPNRGVGGQGGGR